MEALTTVAIGKRARGMHASADGKLIFVALSGSPFAPPGVDESTLPPPDKSADGIGVFDIAQNKMLRKVPGGSDPEQFAVGKDGLLYVSNEDAAGPQLRRSRQGQRARHRPHRRRARRRHPHARRQIRLRDLGRQGHRHRRGHRHEAGRQDDPGGTPSARHRLPARWIARLHHQRERRHPQRDRYRQTRSRADHPDGRRAQAHGHGDVTRRLETLRHHRPRQEGRGRGTRHRQHRAPLSRSATAPGASPFRPTRSCSSPPTAPPTTSPSSTSPPAPSSRK